LPCGFLMLLLPGLAEFAAHKPRNKPGSFFAAACMWRKIPFAERTVRRRKLHVLRFDPKGQSSFIPLLLLFKMEALLPF
jgi:hypothetical protein